MKDAVQLNNVHLQFVQPVAEEQHARQGQWQQYCPTTHSQSPHFLCQPNNQTLLQRIHHERVQHMIYHRAHTSAIDSPHPNSGSDPFQFNNMTSTSHPPFKNITIKNAGLGGMWKWNIYVST